MNQQNKIVRFILRAIDVLVATFGPGNFARRVRWDEDPFQRATEEQKRFGGVFMVLVPTLSLVAFRKWRAFDGWLNSMMYGRHSIIWFYLTVIGAGCCGIFALSIIAPKIPLRISVPTAILMWIAFGWYAWRHLI